MTEEAVEFNMEIGRIVTVYSPVSELKTDESERLPMHSHLWREILVILAGSSKFNLNGQPYSAEPGTVFLIDPQIPHSCCYSDSDHDLVHLWISSSSAMFGSMVSLKERGSRITGGKSVFLSPQVWGAVQERWELLSRLKKPAENLISDYMKIPLTALVDDYRFKLKYKQQNVKVLSVVKILLQHIRINNGRDCSWHKLEQITGFSRYYMAHKFKKECGFSVRDYIEQVRIEYAARAILRGCKQKEIASELGFASPVSYWNWMKFHRERINKVGLMIERCYDSGNKSAN